MIGKLRHSITIEALTRAADDMGGETRTWTTFVTTWSEISPAGSAERYFGQQVQQIISHKITMRYQAGITSKMRVLFGTRYFQIHGVKNLDERNVVLEEIKREAERQDRTG